MKKVFFYIVDYPAYKRESVSRPMRIVALIPKNPGNNILILVV